MSAKFEVSQLSAGYHGHAFVHDLDLSIAAGEVLALIGPNGAGKTTTLLALAGEIDLLGGRVRINGDLQTKPLHARARKGLAFVTEERSVFMKLSVAENLRVGKVDADRVTSIFPELGRLMSRTAGLLSGGEQQMLTVARALSRDPEVLLIDELSLGLAPLVVERLLEAVRSTALESNVSVLLVEQKVKSALAASDRVCVMRDGRIVLTGQSQDMMGRTEELAESYLAARPGAV